MTLKLFGGVVRVEIFEQRERQKRSNHFAHNLVLFGLLITRGGDPCLMGAHNESRRVSTRDVNGLCDVYDGD